MITSVRVTKRAYKQLSALPLVIQDKFAVWVVFVGRYGLEEVRKRPGLHDEPLKGTRAGQRSIRLNKAYRAIYEIRFDGTIEFVSVEEVTKHEY